MKNLKINSKKEFVLCENDQPIREPELSAVQLSNSVFLFRKDNKYVIVNYDKTKHLELNGFVNFFSDYLVLSNNSEFVFYSYENFDSIIQVKGDEQYNINKFNDYILYEGLVYKSSQMIFDLLKLNSKIIDSSKVWTTKGHLIITNEQFPEYVSYFFSYDLDKSLNLNEISSVEVGCSNNYDNFNILTINEFTYIFNSKGDLIFEGKIDNSNFNLGAQKFYLFKHNNQLYLLFKDLIGPLDSVDSEFIELYISHEKCVLLFGNMLIDIDVYDNKYIISRLTYNVRYTKKEKSHVKVNAGIFYLITDGINNYFYNLNKKSLEIINLEVLSPYIKYEKVFYISTDFGISHLDMKCDGIVDYSYLLNDVLFVLLFNNEYNLVSVKKGLLKKSAQPLQFNSNFGAMILINPQPGKMYESWYYNETNGKLTKFPMKLNSTEVKSSRKYMDVRFNNLATQLIIKPGISPII